MAFVLIQLSTHGM